MVIENMKRKNRIIFGAAIAVLMLVAISYATAVNTNTQTTQKESPLYSIRTRLAIGERLQNLKTKLFGERMFCLPFQWLTVIVGNTESKPPTFATGPTCVMIQIFCKG